MYAHNVSLSLKLESAAQFLQKVEHGLIPMPIQTIVQITFSSACEIPRQNKTRS